MIRLNFDTHIQDRFSRASARYDQHARLQQEIGLKLLDAVDFHGDIHSILDILQSTNLLLKSDLIFI